MVDPTAAAFFRKQVDKDPANGRCADSGAEDADWASVSHGIYLSIGASGVHRSLGVKVSFVQSTSMDSWSPLHLKMMDLGGNRRFAEFLIEQRVPKDIPLRRKYQTKAAIWYRENLRALAEDRTPPEPLAPGTGHLVEDDGVDAITAAMLDKVFAAAPTKGQMTDGGVPREFSSTRRRSKSLNSWFSKHLNKMVSSKGSRAAAKLKDMSTGQMSGLGPGDLCTEIDAFRNNPAKV